MVFVENDSFRDLRRPPTDAFRSIPRLSRETLPVAASDLVAWFPFRSGTGEDLTAGDSRFGDTTDYSATVNGATYKPNGGTTDIKTGANSGAFEFDGTDDFLQLPDGDFTEQTFTALGWVKPDVVPSTTSIADSAMLLSPGFDGDIHPTHIVLSDDSLVVRSFDGNADSSISTSTNVAGGSFFFWAVSLDVSTGTCNLYTDGVKQTTGTINTLSTNTKSYRLGSFDNEGSDAAFLDGIADNTRIYNTILSDSQINQIYLNTEP